MKPSTLLITVNFNNAASTIECLKSITGDSSMPFDVFIVDNASSDDSVAKIYKWLTEGNISYVRTSGPDTSDDKARTVYNSKGIFLISSSVNRGFAGGCNIGIKYAVENNYKHAYLLNNDCVVENGFLKIIVDLADSRQDAGIIGSRVCSPTDKSVLKLSSGGNINWLIGTADYSLSKLTATLAVKTQLISGCAMYIRTDIIKTAGFMPEEYFMYYEDSAFCLNAINSGWSVYYEPRSIVYHCEGSTAGKNRAKQLYYVTRSRLMFNKKYNPYFIIFLAYMITVTLLKTIRWVMQGNFAMIHASFIGFSEGLFEQK